VIRVTTPNAVFGLVTEDGKVANAPPVAKWTVGKPVSYVLRYYRNRGYQCTVTA
tara:strand:+ start:643 stop:804 length:162 start_codon:yes stop_codon:yes gene_type:complete